MKSRETKASIGQRLLWLLNNYQGQDGSLNCPVICKIDGPLDLSALGVALDYLVLRHESLRTTFVRRHRQLRQVINEARPVSVERINLSETADPNWALQNALTTELHTKIDAAAWPVRVTLWRLAQESHVLCLNIHHLVTDTWSCMVLQRELVKAYAQGQKGRPDLAPVGWQFSQFMAWQDRQLTSDVFPRLREYWHRQLQGASAPCLPLLPKHAGVSRRRGSVQCKIDKLSAEKLQHLASVHGVTMFAVVLSAYYALLNRLTGQRDLSTATLLANRTRREVENTVGFLTNLVVLRTELGDALTFNDVIKRAWITLLDGIAHQVLPYHLVSRELSASGAPRLDEMVFQMLTERIDEKLQVGNVEFQWMVPDVVGRFDLEVALMACDDGLAVKLYYPEERVHPSWPKDFITAYVAILESVAANPNLPLATLPIEVPSHGVTST